MQTRRMIKTLVTWAVHSGVTKEDLRAMFSAALDEIDQVETAVEIPGGDYKVLDQGDSPDHIGVAGGTGVTTVQDQGDEDQQATKGKSLFGGFLRSGRS